VIYTALVGYPTKQSLSSRLFQIYASSCLLEYAHIKIDVKPEESSLREIINSLKKIGFSGFNVTIPYKLEIMELLDEIDEFSKEIGAVNTVKVKSNKLYGYNTDYIGALKSIEKALGRVICSDDKAVVFGTGGAAKAVVGGLLKYTKKITVFYRSPQSMRTMDFLRRFSDKIDVLPLNSSKVNSKTLDANLVCNATPVGMRPNISATILPFDIKSLRENKIKRVFFDVVYSPLYTIFLKQALDEGYFIGDGLDMMIYQGVEAFKIWTDFDVPTSIVQEAKDFLMR